MSKSARAKPQSSKKKEPAEKASAGKSSDEKSSMEKASMELHHKSIPKDDPRHVSITAMFTPMKQPPPPEKKAKQNLQGISSLKVDVKTPSPSSSEEERGEPGLTDSPSKLTANESRTSAVEPLAQAASVGPADECSGEDFGLPPKPLKGDQDDQAYFLKLQIWQIEYNIAYKAKKLRREKRYHKAAAASARTAHDDVMGLHQAIKESANGAGNRNIGHPKVIKELAALQKYTPEMCFVQKIPFSEWVKRFGALIAASCRNEQEVIANLMYWVAAPCWTGWLENLPQECITSGQYLIDELIIKYPDLTTPKAMTI